MDDNPDIRNTASRFLEIIETRSKIRFDFFGKGSSNTGNAEAINLDLPCECRHWPFSLWDLSFLPRSMIF